MNSETELQCLDCVPIDKYCLIICNETGSFSVDEIWVFMKFSKFIV